SWWPHMEADPSSFHPTAPKARKNPECMIRIERIGRSGSTGISDHDRPEFAVADRGALRDPARSSGAGGFRAFPNGLHRRAERRTDHLAVLDGAGPKPHALGSLRAAPGHADTAALPYRGLRGARRVPEHILYDRMRTVFHREDPETSHIVYNRTLLAFAGHYGYLPKACKAYRAKTKGKVERPFRYIREDFF